MAGGILGGRNEWKRVETSRNRVEASGSEWKRSELRRTRTKEEDRFSGGELTRSLGGWSARGDETLGGMKREEPEARSVVDYSRYSSRSRTHGSLITWPTIGFYDSAADRDKGAIVVASRWMKVLEGTRGTL